MPGPKYIKNTNSYYNATNLNDYTTWSNPSIHPKYNVICKYNEQCSEAYENLKLWNIGCRWKYYNNSLFLELPESIKSQVDDIKKTIKPKQQVKGFGFKLFNKFKQ
jgi:hypothetical protein